MTEPRRIARYGWIPDLPDDRDHLYAAPPAFLSALPPYTDLRAQCPPVYDQGMLGSCTANAIGGAIEFDRLKQSLADFVPSRLFIYYNERVIEHSVKSDAGAMIRDGIKTLAKQGVCSEKKWPYVVSKFSAKPSPACYTEAVDHQITSYQRILSINEMKSCLADGFPFVFGFTVYESFESDVVAKTGVLNMPQHGERVVGGHAVLAVGYDDPSRRFVVRNSWGSDWGMKGYFTMPYDYLTNQNLADDMWTVRRGEGM